MNGGDQPMWWHRLTPEQRMEVLRIVRDPAALSALANLVLLQQLVLSGQIVLSETP